MKMPIVGMVSPSVRTVIVGGYPVGHDKDEVDHEILDLMAIRTMCEVNDRGDDFTTRDELLAWCPCNESIIDSYEIKDRYLSVQMVPCPWDPREDEDRLQDVIKEVKDRSLRAMNLKRHPLGAAS